MPVYDYQCQECHYKFEHTHSIHDDPIKKCPQCKKLKVRRLISVGAGVILKGSGFYAVDHGKKNKKSVSSSDSTDTTSTTQNTDSTSTTQNTDTHKAPKSTESTKVNN